MTDAKPPFEVGFDPIEHPTVLAALARLAGRGTWTRVLQGEEPHVGDETTDALDLADLGLLEKVGVLRRCEGRWTVVREEPWLLMPDTVATAPLARLIRNLEHARGGASGWSGRDPELMVSQGRSSRPAADFITDALLPGMPLARTELAQGRGRFLDVGVGVGAISIAMCQRHDGLTATGLDVMHEALELAKVEVSDAGLTERIELRYLSVDRLDDVSTYHLAWLPQPFIPPSAFAAGIHTVHRALVPGGWVVVPMMAAQDDSPMDDAVREHSAHLMGGGPTTLESLESDLLAAGYVDLRAHRTVGQVLLCARRP